ncbi:PEP-CTERM sorting domain-containing protein [Massilia violaceinigra]|nr:PEP-CTERM sorting domain-containing protein [Massilia violaceinigra]
MKYIATALTAMALCAPAQAKVHVFEFTTTIESVRNVFQQTEEGVSTGSVPGSVVAVDQQVVGRFSYDSEMAFDPNNSTYGQLPDATAPGGYTYQPAPATADRLTFTVYDKGVPTSTESRALSHIRIENDMFSWDPLDRFMLGAGGWPFSTYIILDNSGGTWLPNGELPLRLSLGDVNRAEFSHTWLRTSDNALMSMTGRLHSLTEIDVSPVPEPGTWAMLLAGLGILGFSARRKRA